MLAHVEPARLQGARVRLAVERSRDSGAPVVFWLDETRAHDAEVLKKLHAYLPEHDTDGLQIEVLEGVTQEDPLKAGLLEEGEDARRPGRRGRGRR